MVMIKVIMLMVGQIFELKQDYVTFERRNDKFLLLKMES